MISSLQFRLQLFHRQPDHVAERAGNFRHNQVAVLLNRVGARLVERIDLGEVIVNLPGGQRPEGYVCADGENAFPMRAKMNQADAGNDLVRPSLQSRQHAASRLRD